MKKTTYLLAMSASIVSIAPMTLAPVYAQDSTQTDTTTRTVSYENINYSLDDTTKTATIISSPDAAGDIVIPAEIEGYPVVAFNSTGLFYNNHSITSFDFSHTYIKNLPSSLFMDCINLTSVKFPNSLESLEAAVFLNTSITYLDLSNTKITQLISGTFANCDKMQEIKFPNTLIYIQAGALSGLTTISSLDLSNTQILRLGGGTFSGCISLEEIKFPNTLEELTTGALYDYDLKITSLDLSNTKIKTLMNGCIGIPTLTSIKLPTTLESFGNVAIDGTLSASIEVLDLSHTNVKQIPQNLSMPSLKQILLPNTLHQLVNGNFINTNLTWIDLSNTDINNIGERAFRQMNAITISKITLPKNTNDLQVNEKAFVDAPKLTHVYSWSQEKEVPTYLQAALANTPNITYVSAPKLEAEDTHYYHATVYGEPNTDAIVTRNNGAPSTMKFDDKGELQLTEPGEYTVSTYTNDGGVYSSKTFTLKKSDSLLTPVVMKNGVENSLFTHGETIDIKVHVSPTFSATRNMSTNQIALFANGVQLSDAVEIHPGETVTLSYDTTKGLLKAGDNIPIEVHYVGNDNIADNQVVTYLTINKASSTLTIKDTLNKTFDGISVNQPTVSTDGSNGNIHYTWYVKENDTWIKLDKAPTDPGSYKVVATLQSDDFYEETSSEHEFTIAPKVIQEDNENNNNSNIDNDSNNEGNSNTGNDSNNEGNSNTDNNSNNEGNSNTGNDSNNEGNSNTGNDSNNGGNSNTGNDSNNGGNSNTGNDSNNGSNSNTDNNSNNEGNSNTDNNSNNGDNSITNNNTNNNSNSSSGNENSLNKVEKPSESTESTTNNNIDNSKDKNNTSKENKHTTPETYDSTNKIVLWALSSISAICLYVLSITRKFIHHK